MSLNLEHKIVLNQELIDAPNILDRFGEDDQKKIADHIWTGYARDKQSRSRWERRMSAAMDLAMQVQQAKSFPWPGASNVVFPLVTIGALQFSARSYSNIIQGTQVVRYRTIGGGDTESNKRATRIGQHMSWQVLEEDVAWEEQHDRLLINLAIVGCNFIKTYYNPSLGYVVSELVMAKDFVIDYWAKSVEQAARKTHRIPLYKNEIYERVQQKLFIDVLDKAWYKSAPQFTSPSDPRSDTRRGQDPAYSDDSAAYVMLEQHCWMDLDGDGYEEPYIGTIEEGSKQPLRLTSRVDSMDQIHRRGSTIEFIKATESFTKYSFIPSPDGGVYDLGFGTFLGPLNEAVNSGINQLLDNGTMQNSIGGFLGRGAKIRGGVYTLAPFQWARVDSTGDDLRKNIVPFPDRPASDVMFKLIGFLVDYANRVAGTQDMQMGENPGQNTPASTYQGMQEAGMQTYGMIFKRVWRCMKEEFKKRYALNARYLASVDTFGNSADKIYREDYKGNPDQIAPVANPNINSSQMRFQVASAVKQAAMMTPGYEIPEVERAWLTALQVENIDTIYPGPDKVKPLPNPKMAVEQMKMQGKQLQIDAEKQKWANHLMEERRVNNAKIMQLEAQAYSLIKGAQAADVEHKLAALQLMIDHFKNTNEQTTQQIQALMGAGDETKGQDSNGGGVPRLAGPSGNAGGDGVSQSGSGDASGAVGGGGSTVQ